MDVIRVIGKANWPNILSFFYQGTMTEFLYIRSLKGFAKEYYPSTFSKDEPIYLAWGIADLIIED